MHFLCLHDELSYYYIIYSGYEFARSFTILALSHFPRRGFFSGKKKDEILRKVSLNPEPRPSGKHAQVHGRRHRHRLQRQEPKQSNGRS